MSARVKIQLSRLAIISVLTVLLFSAGSTAAIASTIGELTETSEALATMNAMQLMATVCVCLTVALVVVVGFYVRSVTAFQKESAVAAALHTAKMAEIATALHAVSENCNRKVCPR